MKPRLDPNFAIVLVTSNADEVEELRSELGCKIYFSECNPVNAMELAENDGVRAVVFYTPRCPHYETLHAARKLARARPDLEVLVVSAVGEGAGTIQALRARVVRKLTAAATPRDVAREVLELFSDPSALPQDEMVGHCPSLWRVKELIRRVAPGDMTVLITGETGTGKELAARAIHRLSPRRDQPFVCVNCAAIPDGLLESELFGHEKGSFTGAVARQEGKLRAAHRGTIFLDEIGDMTPATQAKILRVLESREVQPLGAKSSVQVDVRVVAATHQDLGRLMEEQRFRSDLYFRLNVLPVRLPPLRERGDDIPELVDHFVAQLNQRYRRDVAGVTKGGLRLLRQQEWPGNIRQLRNVIEGAYLVATSSWITSEDLRWLHWAPASVPKIAPCVSSPSFPHMAASPEPDRLLDALQATRWNKSKTAEMLHWSRMTVYRKIAKYRLNPKGAGSETHRVMPARAC